MKTLLPPRVAKNSGFSLVEILVVIAIIGVLTTMAIVVYAGVRDQADQAKNERNAKAVSLIAMAALSTGSPDLDGINLDGPDAKSELIDQILLGVNIPGEGSTSSFASPGIDPKQKDMFIGLLNWDSAGRVLSLIDQ